MSAPTETAAAKLAEAHGFALVPERCEFLASGCGAIYCVRRGDRRVDLFAVSAEDLDAKLAAIATET